LGPCVMSLAQTADAAGTGSGILRVFDYLLRLQFPPRAEFVSELEATSTLVACLLVLAGVAYLVYGFRIFKFLVVANGAAIGGLCGAYLGSFHASPNMPLLMGAAGAILLGVLAKPAVKYAVGLFSAVAGGLIGFALWHFVAHALGRQDVVQHAWAGGVIGMVAAGMLTFVALRPAVMIFAALQGAIMIVSGLFALLLAHAGIRESIKPELVSNDYLMTMLIAVPAAVGFAIQTSAETVKIRKKRKATEKPPV